MPVTHPVVTAIQDNRRRYRDKTGMLLKRLTESLLEEQECIEAAIIKSACKDYSTVRLGKDELPKTNKALDDLNKAGASNQDVEAVVRRWARIQPWGKTVRVTAQPHYALISITWRKT